MGKGKVMPVVQSPSGDQFVSLQGINDLPNVKVEDMYLGCINSKLKLSYLVSAPLHMKGFFQFFGKIHPYHWVDKFFVTVDLLSHLGAWIAALCLEIWINNQEDRGSALLAEVSKVSLWALIVAWTGIAIASGFALFGQEVGKLFASTYAVVVGGAYTSIMMSLVWILQSASWAAMVAQYDDSSLGDDLKTQRHYVLWSFALKICAVVCLKHNAAFWGPAIVDEEKEKAEKKAQWHIKYPTAAAAVWT